MVVVERRKETEMFCTVHARYGIDLGLGLGLGLRLEERKLRCSVLYTADMYEIDYSYVMELAGDALRIRQRLHTDDIAALLSKHLLPYPRTHTIYMYIYILLYVQKVNVHPNTLLPLSLLLPRQRRLLPWLYMNRCGSILVGITSLPPGHGPSAIGTPFCLE